jgi:hypothetical protein
MNYWQDDPGLHVCDSEILNNSFSTFPDLGYPDSGTRED